MTEKVYTFGNQNPDSYENPHLQMKNNLLEFPHKKAFGFESAFKTYTEDHKYKEELDIQRLGLGPPEKGSTYMPLPPQPVTELHHTKDQKLIFFCTPIGAKYIDEEVTLDMSVVEVSNTLKYWAHVSDCLQSWSKQFGPIQTKGWRLASHVQPTTTPRPHATVWSM